MTTTEKQEPIPVKECKTEQEVINHFNQLRSDQSTIMQQIAQVEAERHEHRLVLDTLKPLDGKRKCHRLVGGVLVEHTVGEVMPAIDESLTNFDALLHNLSDILHRKDQELNQHMAKYKIKVGDGQQQQAQASQGGKQSGVLA